MPLLQRNAVMLVYEFVLFILICEFVIIQYAPFLLIIIVHITYFLDLVGGCDCSFLSL